MRPLLRDHVWYVEAPGGAYVHGLAGACTLTGAHTFELLTRLAPHLTGEHTLDDLVAGLAGPQQAAVREMVGALAEQQFVVDAAAADDRPHALDADELRTYAAEIAFIRFGLDSAEWRFQQLREARIGVLGNGPVLAELLRAGLWSGWRRTRVIAPAAEVETLRAVATRRDDRQEVQVEAARGPLGAWVPELVRDADVVLQVSSDVSRTELITVGRECHRAGTPVGQVLVDRAEAWLVPVGPPATTAPELCWRRLAPVPPTADDWLLGPVPGLVAAQLALSCSSHLTGLDTLPAPDRPPGVPVLIGTDLRTLVTRTHRVPVHPRAEARDRPRATPLEEVGGPPVDGAELLERAAQLVDARTGLLRLLAEDELTQVPLAVCRARVSDPDGVLPAWAPSPTVHGWGADRQAARMRALLAGLAVYGTLTVPREPGDRWGIDPVSGARHRVPAPLAATVPFQPPVGAAAALTWEDAVATGLRDHCEAILRRDNRPGRPVVDLPALVAETADERVGELHDLLRATALDVRVEDLGDRMKLPAFLLRAGIGPRVTTCAATVADALHDGLERLLLHWQTGLDPSRALAPARTALVSGTAELVAALARHGHVPLVVPLAHDPVARELLGHVVQVVLHGD
jgi:hypothetical protein